MERLINSIKMSGVIEPAFARPIDNGEYQLLSGHRRKCASQKIGLDKMPVKIVECSDYESLKIMIQANNRSLYLFS